MKRFTVYIERDVAVHAKDDRVAAQIADSIHSRIDDTINSLRDSTEIVHAHTTAHRGEGNKRIYDSEDESVR